MQKQATDLDELRLGTKLCCNQAGMAPALMSLHSRGDRQ